MWHCAILAAIMSKQFNSGLMWFRADLRVVDNAALWLSLKA
jgi:deoxyribodipyrimidine photolyase